ncbi:MAG: kinase/pyrophosphorylase [Deltaproteobacteria bacterium]|nr:kinase/pyrophosphorylase [Deltaproteobacteria bacterium]
MKAVVVISDATGETAEKVVRAALLQFKEITCDVRVYSRVRLESEMEQIVEKAAELRALVVYTLVNAAHRELLWGLCDRVNVDAIDLIGGLMGKLTAHLGQQPSGVPGLLHAVGEDYFRRIEAVEFTVKNDDGTEPRNLPKADLVVVGISRTSKTPLSTYLAQKGYRVANIPIVLGIEPPAELAQVDPMRVYGLTIQPDALVKIRQARLAHLGMPADSSYAMRDHIQREIAYAQEVFRKHPDWPVIDVTARAIEETAADILRIMRQRASSGPTA